MLPALVETASAFSSLGLGLRYAFAGIGGSLVCGILNLCELFCEGGYLLFEGLPSRLLDLERLLGK